MNKNYKLLIGIGALAALYFVFKKKGTSAKSTSADKAESSTIKSAKVEGGTISIDEKEILDNIKSKTAPQAGDSPKVVAIKKFFAEVTSNPPKSEEEFLSRASKAGLSKADLQSPEAQKIMNPFASFEDGVRKQSPRVELRKRYGLSVADDKILTSEKRKIRKYLQEQGKSPKQIFRGIRKHLMKFAKNNSLNFDAFMNVEKEYAQMQRKNNEPNYQNYAGELESRIGDSRIKPTSVSGLSVAKRARNYGTAQRPTRALMGKRVEPMATSARISDSMDFDGNNDTLAAIM